MVFAKKPDPKGNGLCKIPPYKETQMWRDIIGDALQTEEVIPVYTLFNAIFGRTWLYTDRKRTWVWKKEHFRSGQLPARHMSKNELRRHKSRLAAARKEKDAAAAEPTGREPVSEEARYKAIQPGRLERLLAQRGESEEFEDSEES